MNDNRHPIDDLFRDGLHDYEEEAPMHVWERIDQARSPLKKFLSNLKGYWKIYAATGAAAAIISCSVWLGLGDFNQADNQTPSLAESKVIDNNSNTEQNTAADQPLPNENLSGSLPSITKGAEASEIEADLSTSAEGANTTPPNAPDATESTQALLPANDVGNENLNAPQTEQNEEITERYSIVNSQKVMAKSFVINENLLSEAPVLQNIVQAQVQQNQLQANKALPQEPRWSLGLAYGLGASSSNLNTDNSMAQALNQAEKFGLQQSLQLQLAYQINPLFSLSTGIRVTQLNSDFNGRYTEWVKTYEQKTVNGVIIDPIMGSRNIQYQIMDTVYNPVNKTQVQANRYRLIDLPIGVQYTWFKTDRWNLNAGAEALINLSMIAQGSTYAPDLSITDHRASNTLKPRIGADVNFSLGLGYNINRQWEWTISPQYRLGLSNWMANGLGRQQVDLWQIQSGLRYRF